MKKILTAMLIAVVCFQPTSFATVTIGQERIVGSVQNPVRTYSDIWLGNNSTGYTFLGWIVPYRAGNSVIRVQPFLNHEPQGDPVIVHEAREFDMTSPRGCADDNGNVYLLWHYIEYELFFNHSSDFGQTWKPVPTRIATGHRLIEDGVEPTTAMSCDGKGNIYVFWFQAEDKQPRILGNIYFTHSADFGKNWSDPIQVNSPDARIKRTLNTGRPVFASGSKGRLYAAWLDERDVYTRQLFLNYSADHGATWQPSDIRIDQGENPYNLPTHVVLGADLIGNVYVAWERGGLDVRNSLTTYTLLRRSEDGGGIWQNQQFINYDYYGKGWTRSRSGNTNIAFDGQGSVYGFWRRNLHDQGDRAALRFSRDYGVTWSQQDIIVDQEYSWDTGEMCVDPVGKLYVVYGKQIPGYAGYHLFVNVSLDKGQTWECSAAGCRLDNNASTNETSNPQHFNIVCDTPGRASVIWYDHREGLENNFTRGYFNTVEVS